MNEMVYSLEELKLMINRGQEEIMSSLTNAVDKAIMIGGYLSMAKGALGFGAFEEWVNDNCSFAVRTAQRYMKVFENKDVVKLKGVNSMTEAIALISPPKEKAPKIEKDDWEEGDFEDVEVEIVEEKSEEYRYWEVLGPLVSMMDSTYEKMKKGRNHTTPAKFSHLIGNIKQMACRIDTWNPAYILICDTCEGKGTIEASDGKNGGAIKSIQCKDCFTGKAGLSSKTDF